jgi:hypothetical protein
MVGSINPVVVSFFFFFWGGGGGGGVIRGVIREPLRVESALS